MDIFQFSLDFEELSNVQNEATHSHQLKKKGRNGRNRMRKHNNTNPEVTSMETFKWRGQKLTLTDVQNVASQLGYLPNNIIEVCSKGINEEPLVTSLYPLNFNLEASSRYTEGIKPFPTMFWITCPTLKANISKLEVIGWVSKLQIRLNNGENCEVDLAKMNSAHQMYIDERWSCIKDEDREILRTEGWENLLNEVGIAGIRDRTAVKCLHAHYAHYLARPSHMNVIGSWVADLLEQQVYESSVGERMNDGKQRGREEDLLAVNHNEDGEVEDEVQGLEEE